MDGVVGWPFEYLLRMDPLVLEWEDAVEDLLEVFDDLRESVEGRSCISLLKSLKTFSNPGCICRAIIGKLLSKSLNDRTSFFLTDEEGPESTSPLKGSFGISVRGFKPFNKVGSRAGVILIGSYEPTRGLEM